MAIFTRESLETLRQKVDLVELLRSYVDLKAAGGSYKAVCPFHDEKTPSFVVRTGDTHYHCFGCGAHGDAISFLMEYQRLSFGEAVESLADRFQVHLDTEEGKNEGRSKKALLLATEQACGFFHFSLLHTQEGQEALKYLYRRGLDLDFIREFRIGLAPKESRSFFSWMKEKKIFQDDLVETGLAKRQEGRGLRSFFYDRITFPIHQASGPVIGFSARKYKETTFGGKYVNTPETPLFKKSRVLFGLNYSRREIAKQKTAIIVEGQVDALRLISKGFLTAVAGQGTAFGEGHVAELKRLGLRKAYLALDGDQAGKEAAVKIGNLLQKVGIDVVVAPIPKGSDPDGILHESGAEGFQTLLDQSVDYLSFLYREQGRHMDLSSPAGKNQLVYSIAAQIRGWEEDVMIHESLKQLAKLAEVPETLVGAGQGRPTNLYIQKSDSVGRFQIDPNWAMETDLLRWLLTSANEYARWIEIARLNLDREDFHVPFCQNLFEKIVAEDRQEPPSLIDLVLELEEEDAQLKLAEILNKKIDRAREDALFTLSIQKILERNWMLKREEISRKMQEVGQSDDEMHLLKEFQLLNQNRPKLKYGKED